MSPGETRWPRRGRALPLGARWRGCV